MTKDREKELKRVFNAVVNKLVEANLEPYALVLILGIEELLRSIPDIKKPSLH